MNKRITPKASPTGADWTRQTGPHTAPADRDVADPHPSDEEPQTDAPRPGGEHPPRRDLGPNDAINDGTAPPRPHNAGSGPR
ncbi:hypothetical protein XM25_07475 [Devosia sp. H5989]|nr:hypothetical protein XM25_07475 [Devosia sp. H5989]